MSTFYQLGFERPVIEVEREIDRLEQSLRDNPEQTTDQIGALETLRSTRASLLHDLYKKLKPWDTVPVARHPNRPQTRDYIAMMCRDFAELHGDRRFGDDPALDRKSVV